MQVLHWPISHLFVCQDKEKNQQKTRQRLHTVALLFLSNQRIKSWMPERCTACKTRCLCNILLSFLAICSLDCCTGFLLWWEMLRWCWTCWTGCAPTANENELVWSIVATLFSFCCQCLYDALDISICRDGHHLRVGHRRMVNYLYSRWEFLQATVPFFSGLSVVLVFLPVLLLRSLFILTSVLISCWSTGFILLGEGQFPSFED